MKKLAFLAAVATLAFSAPSYADEMAKCSEDSLMKMEADLKAMPEPDQAAKDKMAKGMTELEMAMKADKDGMAKECAMHLDAAMKAVQG